MIIVVREGEAGRFSWWSLWSSRTEERIVVERWDSFEAVGRGSDIVCESIRGINQGRRGVEREQ